QAFNGWNTLQLPVTVLGPANYWLAYIVTSAGTVNISHDIGAPSNTEAFLGGATWGPFPGTFAPSYINWNDAIYAAYCPVAPYTPTITNTPTATPTLPVCSVSPKLDLRVNQAVCSTNLYNYQFQVYNVDTVPVTLSDLVIKLWINDTGSICTNVLTAGNLFNGANGFINNVSGTTSSAVVLSTACTTPASRQANWEVRFQGTNSQAIPPGGKWVDGKIDVHRCDAQPFDNPNDDFSQMPAWQGSCLAQNWPVTYGSDPYFALYYQGGLIQEWSDSDHQDLLRGTEPSCIVACRTPTPFPTVTPTSTPSNTPTNTPSNTPTNTPTITPTNTVTNSPTLTDTPGVCGTTPKLDLKVRQTNCQAGQWDWRFQIYNYSGNPVNLTDLEVRLWINDIPPSGLCVNNFTAGAIYDGTNTYLGNVPSANPRAIQVGPCSIPANGQANWQLSLNGLGAQTIPGGGGKWVDGQLSVHRCDFSNFSAPTDDYSQMPAGQPGGCIDQAWPSVYQDDFHYALYYKGTLVFEWINAITPDPNTGIQPFCLPIGCVPPAATLTPTTTPTNT
ncbi:MAG TPA: hypothetical protein VIJ93_00300, partial [bacterium]